MSKSLVTSFLALAVLLAASSCRNTQQQPAPAANPPAAAGQAQPATAAPGEPAPAPAATNPAPGAVATESAPASQAAPATRAPANVPTPPSAVQATAPAAAQPTQAGDVPPAAPAPPAAPVVPEPPKPEYQEITVPAGTLLPIVLETSVASDMSKVDDPVRGRLTKPIVVKGHEVLAKGARVSGSVTEAKASGKVKGLARVAFRFTRVNAGDENYRIQSGSVVREAQATKSKDAKKIGIGAGAGALIGGIAGGGKGAAIGAGVGGGAGTGVVLATKGQEVRVAEGATVSIKLLEPLTVRVLVKP